MQSGLGSIAQFSDEYWQITGDILGAMRQLERHLGESAFEMSQLLSGRFQFANGSSSTDISMFWDAIFYISGSEHAREMLATILISDIRITVRFIDEIFSRFGTYNPITTTIEWNPLLGAEVRNRVNYSATMRAQLMQAAHSGWVTSPAMILAHELGHVVQHIAGEIPLGRNSTSADRRGVESRNISNNEQVIARQLGEPVRNSSFTNVRPQIVGGPTQWGRIVNGQFVNRSPMR